MVGRFLGILKWVFESKMGVGRGNLGFFWGFLGVRLVFGLKMGIFGVGIGHLVFGKDGAKRA